MANRNEIWCIAHRGARKEAPENTRAAFERALHYPIDGIELDVQMTVDGVPVLFHDSTLLRVGGGRKRIAGLTYARLQTLNWAERFHPNAAPEPLMRLEQLLPFFSRSPRLLIEIKSHPKERADGHTARLTQKVIAMITGPESSAWQDRLYILSFDPGVLRRAHDLAPHLKKVLNITGRESFDEIEDTHHLWAIDLGIGRLNQSWVHWARSRDLRILCYTCNGPRQVAKALRLDIDGIISDRPDWLTRHLGREGNDLPPAMPGDIKA